MSHEQPLRRTQRAQPPPLPAAVGSIARAHEMLRLRNRDASGSLDVRAAGVGLHAAASTLQQPPQHTFPVVQRFNESSAAAAAAGSGRASAIIFESGARARELMRRQQLDHRGGEAAPGLAIEASALPVSSRLQQRFNDARDSGGGGVAAAGRMLPPLPPKKSK